MGWALEVDDPSPFFDGAATRERRKQLKEREHRLRQIEEKLTSPEAMVIG